MTHAMIDLETLGYPPNGAIIQIGLVMFDPHDYDNENGFLMGHQWTIHPKDALDYGEAHGAAIQFWVHQELEARLGVFKGPYDLPYDAARGIHEVFAEYRPKVVWAKPPQFDLTLLQHFFHGFRMDVPWHHRNERCLRTLMALKPTGPLAGLKKGTKHIALNDAEYQARCVQVLGI